MNEKSQCTVTDSETVVRTYADMVYKLAFAQVHNRTDADDVFQEVFLRYVRKKPPV
jgi:RNA polymerase sigma-70 factor (ECF subfamily)